MSRAYATRVDLELVSGELIISSRRAQLKAHFTICRKCTYFYTKREEQSVKLLMNTMRRIELLEIKNSLHKENV